MNKDYEIKCTANTKDNKKLFYFVLLCILILKIFSYVLFVLNSTKAFSIETLFYFLKLDLESILFPEYIGDLLYSFIALLSLILLLVTYLRIKNFELIIKNNKIIYKNIFGIKKEYSFSEITNYRIIRVKEYYDSKRIKRNGGITIILYLSKKRISLVQSDTNLLELLSFLNDNKIEQKKMLRF